MDFSEAFLWVDNQVYTARGEHLNDLEKKLLQGVWEGKTYNAMGETVGYTANYLRGEAAPKLWEKLAGVFNEDVGKKNVRTVIERLAATPPHRSPVVSPSSHTGLYLDRPPIEELCFAEILSPGGLVRIKAPKGMGKTQLLKRLLNDATGQNYRGVCWDVSAINQPLFHDINAFWQQFCRDVSRALGLEDRVTEWWEQSLIDCSNTKCSNYFDEYLLPRLDSPLVLGLDNFDCLFPYQSVAEEVFKVLRTWYEKSSLEEIWENLRVVVVHSTEIYAYPALQNINYSPFNVGLPVELPEFTIEQVRGLAKGYGRGGEDLTPLTEMVGGHPFLVREAFKSLQHYPEKRLAEVMAIAPTQQGLYRTHLSQLQDCLRQSEVLSAAMKAVVEESKPVTVGNDEAFKLYSLGLVRREGNAIAPRCRLYRLYFQECL